MAKRSEYTWVKVAICILLVIIVCVPAVVHLSHEHADAYTCMDCPMCVLANRLQSLLKQLAVFFVLASTPYAMLILDSLVLIRFDGMQNPSPVALKIRMNN